MTTKQVKHYYNDLGIVDYEYSHEHLVDLSNALEFIEFNDTSSERAFIQDAQASVAYNYSIHESLGESGLGGCLSLEQWRKTIEHDPIEQILKLVLFDFTDKGYLYNEFSMVANSMICEIQFNKALS